MKKIIIVTFICLIFFGCSSSKKQVSYQEKSPSVLFEFKGIKPVFFKLLEKSITKRFEKEGIKVGFVYNFILPKKDNLDYQNLPEYEYASIFDLNFRIDLYSTKNNVFKLSERETNIDYLFKLKLKLNRNEKLLLENKHEINKSRYKDNSYAAIFSKFLLKKYKKSI